MLDLKYIVKNTDEVKRKLDSRGFNVAVVDELVNLSIQRSKFMSELQGLEANRNKLSREIGVLKSQGQPDDALLLRASHINHNILEIKASEIEINENIRKKLLLIPNILENDTPIGKTDAENKEIAKHIIGRGEIKNVKPHYEIAVDLDIVDFERAVKISGTRFWSYKGLGSKLVRALENFMLDVHVKNGYTELRPPLLVKEEIMRGTGQLPKFKKDIFKVNGRDLYLIPTAEVPITNFFANEIIDLSSIQSFTAFTPCFRAEAGSAGKDTRGLIRAHQFNKVEIVKFASLENKDRAFNEVLESAKSILEALQLPYRELRLCSGDVGFSSEKTIDLEVWIPSEGKYREISSVSSFGQYQARRAMIRYKNDQGKSEYATTINGSALAIDRTVAAILENYQNTDGSITIPDVLVPYMGITEIKK